MALAARRRDNARLRLVDPFAAMHLFPVRLRGGIAALVLLCACTPVAASSGAASSAAMFERDLVATLECRVAPATAQAVVSTLRAAMYGDPQQRPALLREWRFERVGDDEASVVNIDMPVGLTAHGITTRRLVADDIGLAMPIDAASRARIVAAHGLRLQSSTLREPLQVWSVQAPAGSAPVPASIVVRSDGQRPGYRLGCDYDVQTRDERVPARLRAVASAQDVAAALECRADPAALQRIATTLERVVEQPQLAWPDSIRAVAERGYVVGEETLPAHVIELDQPLNLHGFPVQRVAVSIGGYIAGDLGQAPLAKVLAATGMDAAARQGDGVWTRSVARDQTPGRTLMRERSVLQTDDGTVLAGCMSSSTYSAPR